MTTKIVRLRMQTYQLTEEAQKKFDLTRVEDKIKEYLQTSVPDAVLIKVLHTKISLYYRYNDVLPKELPDKVWYTLKHIVHGVYPRNGITYQLGGDIFDYKNKAEYEVAYAKVLEFDD